MLHLKRLAIDFYNSKNEQNKILSISVTRFGKIWSKIIHSNISYKSWFSAICINEATCKTFLPLKIDFRARNNNPQARIILLPLLNLNSGLMFEIWKKYSGQKWTLVHLCSDEIQTLYHVIYWPLFIWKTKKCQQTPQETS